METVLSLIIIALTGIIIFVVEKFTYKRKATPEEVEEYQTRLDEQRDRLKQFNVNMSFDAKTQLARENRAKKGLIYFYSGFTFTLILLLFIFAGLPPLYILLSLLFSAFCLIIIGFFKFADSKIYLLKVLTLVIIIMLILYWLIRI